MPPPASWAPRIHAPLALGLLFVLLAGCSSPSGPGPSELPGPWEHRFVELEGRVEGQPLRMHTLSAGPEDGVPVVLVHGFPDLSYGWRQVLPDLSRDHRVLAPDQRGYGGTDRPESGYDVPTLAEDLAAFIEQTGGPVHLVGHDWGAAVGWALVMARPELVRSWTAISVPHPVAWARILEDDAGQRKRATYQKTFAQPGVAALIDGFGRKQLGEVYRSELVHPEALSEADLDHYWRAFDTVHDWRPPLRYYQEAQKSREALNARAASFPPVSVPTLILWGAQDSFLYARNAERSCDFVAAPCTVTVYEDAGHWVPWEVGDKVVADWRAFEATLP